MLHTANPQAGYLALKPEIDAAVQGVLQSGSYVLGPAVEVFERRFAAWLGVAHAVGVNSGTDALHLALRARGIGVGDEVITVAHTAVATVAAIEMAGAAPVLVDVEPGSRTIDPAAVARAVGPATRAVIAVHLYGQPARLDALRDICGQHRLALLEDCAQAHGACWGERRVGTVGDLGAFSFYPTKNLGGIGDGGMVVTSDDALARDLRRLRQYGWDAPQLSAVPGWNSRLDPLQAAVLGVKLPHLDGANDARRALARRYGMALRDLPLRLPADQPGCRAVHHLYVVEVADRLIRDALQAHLLAAGIAAGIHYPTPVHLQPAYAGRLRCGPLPVTEHLAATVLSLPLYPELAQAEQDQVVAAVRAFFGAQP
jgi:dTDP-4-amino-4,6-dideoxygalactose transaminase